MRLLIGVLILLVAACGHGVRPDAGMDVQALRQRLGAAQTVVASLLVQIVPEDGEAEMFTVRLWSTADRAIRLRVLKLDVTILDARVRPDGAYEALLVREHVTTSGMLGSADDPLLLRDLRLLIDELRYGPIPSDAVVTAGPSGLTWPDATGWQAGLELAADGFPSAKVLSADGVEMRRLAYQRWRSFDALTRPAQVTLQANGDAAVVRIRVKSLDDPGAITAERMALTIPDDAERVDPTAFTERMPR
jgi:hypothetical protein